ncbi:Bax inhibitor-1/YccA family protein [Catellicoccus marimammalium]|uniref:Membrane protein n=1 Tax=Catellicoccus marimammalium M35/04/3 TaxID=1234409 RepID=K8Z7H8_9ENTE|nr:Bax inhibitor-1/YccA family protein [Catellicoccus marimammalium]EKU26865.1 membrane protein [Catellicoccus marimammalium M35/04/3]
MNQRIIEANTTGLNRFFGEVYAKVALGVGVSALVSFILIYFMPNVLVAFANSTILWIVLCIVEIMLVISAGHRAYSGNSSGTMMMYMVYSIINALTLTVGLTIVSSPKVIAQAFLVTALMFVAMSIYGRTTKRDLSAWRNFLMGISLGVIITLLVNLILGSGALSFFCSLVSVALFAGYMAYDTQMIIRLYQMANSETKSGLATYGAMNLYMDLIAMFINLLQILDVFNSDNNN